MKLKVWCKISSKYIKNKIQKIDPYNYHIKSGKKYYIYLVEIDNLFYLMYTSIDSLLARIIFNSGNLFEIVSNPHYNKIKEFLLLPNIYNNMSILELDIKDYTIRTDNTNTNNLFNKHLPTGTNGLITIKLDYLLFPEYLY